MAWLLVGAVPLRRELDICELEHDAKEG